jgi:glucosamine 6-phosphate synthetase-like amidotransferase/phosphosugar isomerase protein
MTDGAIDSTNCALQLPAYHMALALVVDADESGALAKSVMDVIGFQYF